MTGPKRTDGRAWGLAALLSVGLLLLAEVAAAQRGPCAQVPETAAYVLTLVATVAFVSTSLLGGFARRLATALAFGGLVAAGMAWALPPLLC